MQGDSQPLLAQPSLSSMLGDAHRIAVGRLFVFSIVLSIHRIWFGLGASLGSRPQDELSSSSFFGMWFLDIPVGEWGREMGQ